MYLWILKFRQFSALASSLRSTRRKRDALIDMPFLCV